MSTATAEAETPKMSISDVARVSELKDLGWTVDGQGKEWFAYEKAGDLRSIGPATTVKALYTQVKLAVGEPMSGEDNPKKGQQLLPNTQDAVLQDLRSAVLAYRATTMDILDLQKRQKEEAKMATALMHKFENELSVDPETGFKYFQVEMIVAELEIETKEKLVTRAVSS